MQRHIHMHKNLHSAMLTVWRKQNIAQEMGVEKSSAYKKELASQRIVWQLRNSPHPEKKEKLRL